MIQFRNNWAIKYLLSIFTLNILMVFSAQAIIGQVQVNVSVEILAPTCSINGNTPIDVDFGPDLNTVRINGANYIQTLAYSMDCPDVSSNNMRIKIGDTESSFDSRYLSTSEENLGIVFYKDGNQMDLNQWTSFTYPTKPVIRAAPIKPSNVVLSGGVFVGTATMYIEYQ